jgi:hypothetical protein
MDAWGNDSGTHTSIALLTASELHLWARGAGRFLMGETPPASGAERLGFRIWKMDKEIYKSSSSHV